MKARNRFRRWVAWQLKRGRTRTQIANAAGFHPSLLTRLLSGERTPSLRVAHGIERASAGWPEGAIRTEEWVAAPTTASTGTDS